MTVPIGLSLPNRRLIYGHNSIEIERGLRAYCNHKPFTKPESEDFSKWCALKVKEAAEEQRRKIQ